MLGIFWNKFLTSHSENKMKLSAIVGGLLPTKRIKKNPTPLCNVRYSGKTTHTKAYVCKRVQELRTGYVFAHTVDREVSHYLLWWAWVLTILKGGTILFQFLVFEVCVHTVLMSQLGLLFTNCRWRTMRRVPVQLYTYLCSGLLQVWHEQVLVVFSYISCASSLLY